MSEVFTLDARDLMCPEPILKAQSAIGDLAPGSSMIVLATDLAAPIDFEVWCQQKGHRYMGSSDTGEWLVIRLKKNSA
jgi:tRNA 2-thiouridine synthesizing protein A